jgi:hypothetical protein
MSGPRVAPHFVFKYRSAIRPNVFFYHQELGGHGVRLYRAEMNRIYFPKKLLFSLSKKEAQPMTRAPRHQSAGTGLEPLRHTSVDS